jgi:hypothetical protein
MLVGNTGLTILGSLSRMLRESFVIYNADCSRFYFICYLTTLPVSGLYSIGDRLVNEYGAVWGIRIDGGKPKDSEKTCSGDTSSTINPALSDLGWNPGRSSEKPTINPLSYGTVYQF